MKNVGINQDSLAKVYVEFNRHLMGPIKCDKKYTHFCILIIQCLTFSKLNKCMFLLKIKIHTSTAKIHAKPLKYFGLSYEKYRFKKLKNLNGSSILCILNGHFDSLFSLCFFQNSTYKSLRACFWFVYAKKAYIT